MQNRWAQISERCDDVYRGVKYGAGPQELISRLEELSERLASLEIEQIEVLQQWEELAGPPESHPIFRETPLPS